jgi:hypothetical protein
MELRVNNTLWNLSMFLLVLASITTLVVVATRDNTSTLVSTKGCCSITTTQLTEDIYQVTWNDNTIVDGSYSVYVEVEYPVEGQTEEETLEYELNWAIAEMQDTCFTHHNH